MSPNSRLARVSRIAGIVLTAIGIIIAIPFIVVKMFTDASGARR